MEALKKKILEEGQGIGTEIVKVDSFLNHQLDVQFLAEIGKEFGKRFAGEKIDRILTVEASGIAVACAVSPFVGNPRVVFAKKAVPSTMVEGFYEAEAKSFTKGTVSSFRVAKKFINKGENILIIDDFLARGGASLALKDIVEQGEAKIAGVGIVIEKAFQGGRELLEKDNIKVESLAIIEKIEDGKIIFK